MASLMQKLGIRARLGLATIPELGAWSTPSVETRVNGSAPVCPLSGNGHEVDPQTAAHLWREIASGYWSARTGVDVGGLRHAVLVRDSPRDVDWRLLTGMHREVLARLADGLPLKAVAMKLGLASSTVSSAMGLVRRRLGFASLIQVVRAYCAMRDIIDEPAG
jgi:DNA-binding CsgD family transcriptional regulator